MDNKQIDKKQEDEITSISGCFIRIFWCVLGPIALFLCACIIGTQKVSLPSVFDMIYGIVLVIMIIARFIDQPKQTDKTSKDKSAIKYTLIISIIGIIVWAMARFVLSRLF
jgi:hypothetical protein